MLVKICCISSTEEAEIALSRGARLLGLVSEMPSGPGVIDEMRIREIATSVGKRARTVLLTSRSSVDAIVTQYRECGVSAIQLCEWLDTASRRRLRAILPEAWLMQVVHVTGPDVIAKAVDGQAHVDALLLDSGTLSGSTIELGGTGRTHDWDVSARIVRAVSVPVFLAGGLNPQNVALAIAEVRPDGVDVCSGLRTDGALDERKTEAFFRALSMQDPSQH